MQWLNNWTNYSYLVLLYGTWNKIRWLTEILSCYWIICRYDSKILFFFEHRAHRLYRNRLKWWSRSRWKIKNSWG